MEVEIPAGHELWIEIPAAKSVRAMVTAGMAEVFGRELLNDKWHVFSGVSLGIFTFAGARLKFNGIPDLHFVAYRSSIPAVFAIFDRLHQTGQFAKNILLFGADVDAVAFTLANCLIRAHRKLLLTELNPARGTIFPGTIGTMPVEHLVEHQEGFRLNNPFCFYYGDTELSNPELYDIQTDALAEHIRGRAWPDTHLIIAPGVSADRLNDLIKKFGVDFAVVVGDERMYHKLELVVPKHRVENFLYRDETGAHRGIARYFHGADGSYTLSTQTVRQKCTVVRIGEEFVAPESALPLGVARKIGKTSVNRVDFAEGCVYAVLPAQSEEEVPTSPVTCFVVGMDAEKCKVLAPQPALPKFTYLLQGKLKYLDG